MASGTLRWCRAAGGICTIRTARSPEWSHRVPPSAKNAPAPSDAEVLFDGVLGRVRDDDAHDRHAVADRHPIGGGQVRFVLQILRRPRAVGAGNRITTAIAVILRRPLHTHARYDVHRGRRKPVAGNIHARLLARFASKRPRQHKKRHCELVKQPAKTAYHPGHYLTRLSLSKFKFPNR